VHRFERLPFVDAPKLLLDLRLAHADGSETVVTSDALWQWSEGEITRSWIAEEDVDLRRTGRTWRAVSRVSPPAGRLVPQLEPFNRIVEEVRPVALTYDAAHGVATWDFGRELNGWVRLRAAGPAGTKLTVTTVPVMSTGDGVPAPGRRTSQVTLAGTGAPETYEPRFFHAGLRQVVVAGLVAPPRTNDLTGCCISSMYQPAGGFACSDPIQNELNAAVRRTVVAYTTFLPNDPVREWKAWTQDIENMFRSAVYLFDSRAMYQRWQYDLLDGQRADGNFPNIAPGPFFDDYNSPWWGGCGVWLPWHWYLYYGDDALLRESYPAMKRYVDFLDRAAKNGLQDWGLADWLPVEETPRPLINTPAHFLFAQIVSRTAALLGHPDEAARYAARAGEIRAAFNAAFLDPATGIYGQPGWKVRSGNWRPPVPLEQTHTVWWTGDRPCTQAGQALPLALGLVPPEHRAAVERALLREIAAHSNRVSTGFVATPYLLEVLADLAPEVGWAMTSARDFPSWYGMTAGSGSDVMKETWAGGQALMPSLGGNIAMWHMEALAGIRPDPDGPGFKKFIIKPAVVGDLSWVEAHHDSPHGRIESSWRREGGKVTMTVLVPANTTARIFIPGVGVETVGAGRYRFEGRLP
jgi:alpha-L-rhamnosidase